MRVRGTVKWFDDKKGFGFITSEIGKDFFVHYSGILGDGHRSLQQGQKVEFKIEEQQKGPAAIEVIALR